MGIIKKPPPCARFAAVFSSEDCLMQLVWEHLETQWGKIAALSPAFEFVESPYYLKTMQLTSQSDRPTVLRKQMALFESPYDPGELAADKCATNHWEDVWTAHWSNPTRSSATADRSALETSSIDRSASVRSDHLPAGLREISWGQAAARVSASTQPQASSSIVPSTIPSTVPSHDTESAKRWVNIDPGYMSMTKLVLASTKNREHRIYLRDGIYAEVTLAFRDQAWMSLPWTYADYQRPDVLEFLTMARKGFTQVVAHAQRANLKPQHPLGGES